jgi:16S rRNA (guanine966-N2)-methyltransferase
LSAPADPRVRPTADRIREAWMSIVAEALPGARVLDLFAGSGALGLEALSRGAASVDFVDIAPRSITALKGNIATLGVADVARVHRADALRFAARLAPLSYDMAFADPPYTIETAAAELVATFRATPFARVLTVEHACGTPVDGDQSRRYGDTTITFCYAP